MDSLWNSDFLPFFSGSKLFFSGSLNVYYKFYAIDLFLLHMQILTFFNPWKTISFFDCSFNCQYPLKTYAWNLKEHFTTSDFIYFAISPFVRRNISCYYLKTMSGTYLFSWGKVAFAPFVIANGEKRQFWKKLIPIWSSTFSWLNEFLG